MDDNNLAMLKEFLDKHVKNPPENLTSETRLDNIGLDSMSMLELIFDIEDKYGVHLPDDMPTPETVGQLMALVEKYKPAAANE
jgi:acyl carrier protein